MKRRAFTLIELLVVVAIITLLLSILLPSIGAAKEHGKKAKCLAHLSGIAKAMCQYANDDAAEQIIPIHQKMRLPCEWWEWKTVNWFAWGGRSGQRVFKIGPGGGYLLDDTAAPSGDDVAKPMYAARTRPLTIYLSGDVGVGDQHKLDQFSCPSDNGYPDDPVYVDDAPLANAERSCYETLGNSFRASMFSYADGQQQGTVNGAFALGPWGHRASTLLQTGRTVLCGEPTWFNMIGMDSKPGVPEVGFYGWHKKKMVDNLAYCDGSARSTKAEARTPVHAADFGVPEELARLISRGSTYQLDVYPVGGAIIAGDWSDLFRQYGDYWPCRNFQSNFR